MVVQGGPSLSKAKYHKNIRILWFSSVCRTGTLARRPRHQKMIALRDLVDFLSVSIKSLPIDRDVPRVAKRNARRLAL